MIEPVGNLILFVAYSQARLGLRVAYYLLASLLLFGLAGTLAGQTPITKPSRSIDVADATINSVSASRAAGEFIPPADGVIKRIQLGLDGAYKLGRWTPIQIDFQATQPIELGWIHIEAEDPDGVGCTYELPLSAITTTELQRVMLLVKIGRRQGQLHISLGHATGSIAEFDVPLEECPAMPTGQQLVVGLGSEWGIRDALAQRIGPPAEHVAYRHLANVTGLPLEFLGYDAVDAVVLATSDPTRLASVTQDRWNALRTWVQHGGRMVACIAKNSESFLAAGKPLAWFVPGGYQGPTVIRQTTGIEQFAGGRRVELARAGLASIPSLSLSDLKGVVESAEGYGENQQPTVIRFAAGMGQGVLVAYDLDQPPFAEWNDRNRLATRLIDLVLDPAAKNSQGQADIGPVAHLGFDDLVGQLRRALDRFSEVRHVSFGWIAGLTAIYLLLIGPIDYWFVRRTGRPTLTWLTFPLAAIAFTTLAAVLTYHWKGSQVLLRQVTLIDADLATGRVRGTSWAHLYCPNSQRLAIALEPTKLDDNPSLPEFATHEANGSAEPWPATRQAITSWQGLPGPGFGGLDRSDRITSFRDPYRLAFETVNVEQLQGRLVDFPIATHSSRAFVSQWWQTFSRDDSQTELFASKDSVVSGRVTNPFPADLDDAYILFDRWAFKIGRLRRFETIPIRERVGTDLQSLLTQREFVKGGNVAQPWRVDSVELDRILQLMSFYGAAKGRDYTQLQHRFERHIDWSDHLTANSAILWGRSAETPIDWQINNSPATTKEPLTYYRLLIPVKRRGA